MSRVSSHFSIRDSRFGSVVVPYFNVQTLATAGVITYTADQLMSGLILRDTAGDNRSDVLPKAADLVAAIQGAQVGHAFEVHFRNTADAAETLTITAGTGGTVSGTATIAQNSCKSFIVVLTNVTEGSEAYTAYSKGSATY